MTPEDWTDLYIHKALEKLDLNKVLKQCKDNNDYLWWTDLKTKHQAKDSDWISDLKQRVKQSW